MSENTKIILGVDVGTSGIRASVVQLVSSKTTSQRDINEKSADHNKFDFVVLEQEHLPMSIPNANTNGEITQCPKVWIETLDQLLNNLAKKFSLKEITHFIADATSSTVLLCDQNNNAVTNAVMYNDNRSIGEAYLIKQWMSKAYKQQQAPSTHSSTTNLLDETSFNLNDQTGTFGIGAMGSASSLAKAIRLSKPFKLNTKPLSICHQLDFINQYLADCANITDENNALKLGFDSINFSWPAWVKSLSNNLNLKLPTVVKPGVQIATIKPEMAKRYDFNPSLKIMAGTTDSIAGFLASSADKRGQAVVSLGSTLAVKFISSKAVFDPQQGLYSHRLGTNWLVGGASNAGGKVFIKDYEGKVLSKLTHQQEPAKINAYIKQYQHQFYPLTEIGERFPIADSELKPRLPTKPNSKLSVELTDDVDLEKDDLNKKESSRALDEHIDYTMKLSLGLTEIELQAMTSLEKITGSEVQQIFTVGGGLKNQVWQQFRQTMLSAELKNAQYEDASIGIAKLIYLNN